MKRELSSETVTAILKLEPRLNKIDIIVDSMYRHFTEGLYKTAKEQGGRVVDFTEIAQDTFSFMETLLYEMDKVCEEYSEAIEGIKVDMRSWGVWTKELHNEKGTSTPESESTFNSNTN